ncbi:hypothetical protein RND81_13G102300 [Saponaria officinalis]|uniref:RING-type E3 ubiquitin transferase n=1 Tax=Saponaria officinalis TaxID=3572 RepID=A0AAW1H4D3_SAPOF
MSIMLSTYSIHQHEYYLNHNYDLMDVVIENNFMDEHQTKMIENNLKTKTHHVNKGEDSDVCSICLDEFEEGSCVGVLDCRHQFHSNCLKNWLVINNVCPLCKSTGVRQRS